MPSVVVNGRKKQYPGAVSGIELAKELKLEGSALAMKVNGGLRDLSSQIDKDAEVKLLTFEDAEGKQVFWHTAAHIFACAIKQMYPEALATIGPAVEDGFYYDFDNLKIIAADFEKIEMKMNEIAQKKLKCEKKEVTLAELNKIFIDNPYKRELAEEFAKGGKKLTIYSLGNEFLDLCEGPHLPDTGYVKAMKLMVIASAYWRGDQKNRQLTRVYGTAFPDEKMLKKHLEFLKELELRDHRKLGKDLELFMFHEYSPGSPFMLAKGTVIFNELQKFIREEYRKRGYQEVITPQLFNKALWEQSGHWEHYKENMFAVLIKADELPVTLPDLPDKKPFIQGTADKDCGLLLVAQKRIARCARRNDKMQEICAG